MSTTNKKALLAGLAWAALGPGNTVLAVTPEDQAGIESQCHAEAESYGIAQEQLADYIDGCMLSMGGYIASPPEAEPEDSPPGEESGAPEDSPPGEESGAPGDGAEAQ
ncbi:MAG: hypothetical protein PVJ66_02785 [Gammaproteobacteria bacterium]|jgi:hypothetical protein